MQFFLTCYSSMNQKKKTITGSKKYFPTLIINQHIRLIFDTKDWRND